MNPIKVKSGEILHDIEVIGTGAAAVDIEPYAINWSIRGGSISAPAPRGARPEPWRAVGINVYGGGLASVENVTFTDCATGVYAGSLDKHITLANNRFAGMRGPMPRGQAIQLDHCTGGALIEGNVSDASLLPGLMEDHINFHKCFGTKDAPFIVKNNWCKGGKLGRGSQRDHTGCGINTGDAGGSWFIVDSNTLVMISGAALSAGGSNTVFKNNIAYCWGELEDMTGSVLAIREGSTDIYSEYNRGIARSTIWGGTGQLGAGYWHHPSVTTSIQGPGNNWQDTSLSDSIWKPPGLVDTELIILLSRARSGVSITPTQAVSQAKLASSIVPVFTDSDVINLYASRLGSRAAMTTQHMRDSLSWAYTAARGIDG